MIDGLTNDFAPDEVVFGVNPDGSAQESDSDSRWGPNADIGQIRITWDQAHLYFAGEGIIWDNNMILAIDIVANRGLDTMAQINTWRRLVHFAVADFRPDVFGCTWDRNTAPRLLLHVEDSRMQDFMSGELFWAAATFQRGATGRAMEFRVPWSTLFTFAGGVVARDTLIDGAQDTLYFLPPYCTLRVVGFVTHGADGTGGPDVAPNNTTGCSVEPGDPLIVDNYVAIQVDQDGDGLPDMDVSPNSRVVFYNSATPLERPTWGQVKLRYR